MHNGFVACFFSWVSHHGRFLGHQMPLLRCVCWRPYLMSDWPFRPLLLSVLGSWACQLLAEQTRSSLGRRGQLTGLMGAR